MQLVTCPQCGRKQGLDDIRRAAICVSCGATISAQPGLSAAVAGATRQFSPHPNPTPIKPGMKGRFFGRNYEVRGRVVPSMTEEGETYTWQEFQLIAPDGDEAWLEFDEDVWKFMKPFLPRFPIGPREAAGKRPGAWVNLEGKNAVVTQNTLARLQFAEGPLTYRGEAGDQYEYLDANAGGQLYSVQWGPEEMEFFRGQTLSTREVLEGFGLYDQLLEIERAESKSRGSNFFAFTSLACACLALMLWLGSGPNTGSVISTAQVPVASVGPEGVRYGPFSLNPAAGVHTLQVYGSMTQSSAWVQGILESTEGNEVLEAQGDFWDESGYDDGYWHESYLSNESYFMAGSAEPYFMRLYTERDTPAGGLGTAGYVVRSGVVYPRYYGWYALSTFTIAILAWCLANKETLRRWNEACQEYNDD